MSCESCVHRSDAPELDGLPVCSKLTMPLALSSSNATQRSEMAVTIAGACGDYSRGSKPNQQIVRFPAYNIGANPAIQKEAMDTRDASQPLPTSCTRCKWFVPADVVNVELGWAHGMCLAKAELMPTKRYMEIARTCELSQTGPNATSTAGVILNTAYTGVPMVRADRPAKRGSSAQAPDHHIKVDPREWETEREVDDDHKLAGIRAWRKVVDPSGHGADGFMPIFEHTHPDFVELDQDGEVIDPRATYGDLTPHLYQDYAGLLYTFCKLSMGGIDPTGGLQQTLCYVGESGTGKTEFAGYVAYLMNLPLTRIAIRPSLLGDDLFGSPELVTDEHGNTISKWVDGILAHAYVRPRVVVLDELNTANDDVMMTLRPALDKGRTLTIEKINRRMERHWANFFLLTQNPAHSASYRGTRELSLADKRRFRQIHVPMPDPTVETKIIKAHCAESGYDVPDEIVKTIVDIGNEFRKRHANNDLPESWGVRENIAVAELSWFFSLEQAYRLAALDSMEQGEADAYSLTITSKLSSRRGR